MENINIIPLLILGIFSSIGIGVDLARHGQTITKKTNAWTTIIAQAIFWVLMYLTLM